MGKRVHRRLQSRLETSLPGDRRLFIQEPAVLPRFLSLLLQDTPWAGAESQLSVLLKEIPWGHNILIFTKCSGVAEAGFYINQTLEQGWSRDVLALQLKSNLYARTGKAVTNFSRTLPLPQSDLAQQTIKDPYTFDFMAMKAIHIVEIAR